MNKRLLFQIEKELYIFLLNIKSFTDSMFKQQNLPELKELLNLTDNLYKDYKPFAEKVYFPPISTIKEYLSNLSSINKILRNLKPEDKLLAHELVHLKNQGSNMKKLFEDLLYERKRLKISKNNKYKKK